MEGNLHFIHTQLNATPLQIGIQSFSPSLKCTVQKMHFVLGFWENANKFVHLYNLYGKPHDSTEVLEVDHIVGVHPANNIPRALLISEHQISYLFSLVAHSAKFDLLVQEIYGQEFIFISYFS